jgi:CDGSH-type Zn-finger protein
MDKPLVAQKSPIVTEVSAGTYFWCACGLSNKQPFCDGSHKGGPFSPVKTTIEEAKNVAWCACKQSSKKPFCDGTHRQL